MSIALGITKTGNPGIDRVIMLQRLAQTRENMVDDETTAEREISDAKRKLNINVNITSYSHVSNAICLESNCRVIGLTHLHHLRELHRFLGGGLQIFNREDLQVGLIDLIEESMSVTSCTLEEALSHPPAYWLVPCLFLADEPQWAS